MNRVGTAMTESRTQASLLAKALARPAHWAGDRLLAFGEASFRALAPFVTRHYWIDAGDVNVFRVIGTRHPDYVGLSWLEFLERGECMPANHALWQQNPGYYLGTAVKLPQMSFISVNGQDWYVDADGNHRTCIARFDFDWAGRSVLHGVTLADWRFDTPFAQSFASLRALIADRRLPWRVRHVNRALGRDDNAGWKLDRFENRLVVDAVPGATPAFPGELDAEGIRALIAFGSAPRWRRLFAFHRGSPGGGAAS